MKQDLNGWEPLSDYETPHTCAENVLTAKRTKRHREILRMAMSQTLLQEATNPERDTFLGNQRKSWS